jgi:hypothetical protein
VQFTSIGRHLLHSMNEGFQPLDVEEAVLSASSVLISIVDRRGMKVVRSSPTPLSELLTSDHL